MELIAVSLAALCQLLGCSVFFSQPQDYCSPAPNLASWFFLAATLCFLRDINIYPYRFQHMSRGWQIFIEIVAAIFLVELSSMVVWSGLERCVISLLEEALSVSSFHRCQPSMIFNRLAGLTHGPCGCRHPWYIYWLYGFVTCSVSLAVLWYVLKVTDSLDNMKKLVLNFGRNVRLTWQMMRCYLTMNMSGRRRTLQVCQMRLHCSQSGVTNEDEDDDDDDSLDCYESD